MMNKSLRLETTRPNQPLTINDKDSLNVDLHLRIVDGEVICLTEKYSAEEVIERGRSYITFRATDDSSNQKVAIKKRSNVFPTGHAEELLTAEKLADPKLLRIPKRVLREMRVLCHLHHPNILNLRAFVPPVSYREFGDVLFVLDYVETNLKDLIDADKKLVSDSGKYLMYQILSALNYIHSADLVHGDLRPDRIAINGSCELKVGDIATTYVEDDQGTTEYTSRFWYRAPEVLASNNDPSTVTSKVDTWAAGCVMAEILTGTPLFKSVASLDSLDVESHKQQLSQHIQDPVALDLLNQLLDASPESRLSAEQALHHEYLKELFTPDNLVVCDGKYDWEYENIATDVVKTKRAAFDTLLDFEQVARKPNTPITRLSSPIQRAENIKRMQLRLNSPAVEVSQKDLLSRLQESVERSEGDEGVGAENSQVNTSQEGFASPRERKKSLFERMRDIFGKNNTKK
ncbi:MAP kinase [Acrasis kona]|uniref:MAP kinase n=1 Tax=Acrasis kona TaxID=1008807 RepID=A0AAW2YXR6_9EUKA